MASNLRLELIRHAKNGSTVTYSALTPVTGLNMQSPDERNRLRDMLGEISTDEHRAGRPLLSVIVVRADGEGPGKGFFALARELGVFHGSDETTYFVEELNRVFDCWRNHQA